MAAFVRGFFDAKKPVGAICIAPALVALALHQSASSTRWRISGGWMKQSPAVSRIGAP